MSSVHYDPLLAKLIASASHARRRARRAIAALRSFPILGIRTNSAADALLEHPRFIAGDMDTHFLDIERVHQGRLSSSHQPIASAWSQLGGGRASPRQPRGPRTRHRRSVGPSGATRV